MGDSGVGCVGSPEGFCVWGSAGEVGDGLRVLVVGFGFGYLEELGWRGPGGRRGRGGGEMVQCKRGWQWF